nr:hypothetical protein [uncultured Lachnoanaerobaculum sp.]
MEGKIIRYDKIFNEEVVSISDEKGLKNAAAQLGVSYYTLSRWSNKCNKYGQNAFHISGYKNIEILSLEMRDNMKKELRIDTFISTMKRYDVYGSILHSY